MKSPFPGMDPYLESSWGEVHLSFIVYICEELQPALPEGMFARARSAEVAGAFRPAFIMVDRQAAKRRQVGGTLVVDPPPIVVHMNPVTDTWIEIIETKPVGKVITVIEVLLPSHKQSGAEAYRTRRKQHGDANLVEIDLLREGRRNFAVELEGNDRVDASPYCICVRRPALAQAEIYPLPLYTPLQNVGIPLRSGEPDAVLPLQRMIDKVYEMGRYRYHIDYSQPLTPPLSDSDQQWVREILDASRS